MAMSTNAGMNVLKYPPYSYKIPPSAGPTNRPKLWLMDGVANSGHDGTGESGEDAGDEEDDDVPGQGDSKSG
ncbi:MAG: hypothetical protein Q9221_005438 [Calogaya cf. arnoldii]